jgi:Fe2+ or Zn2+ uptake regulation protein
MADKRDKRRLSVQICRVLAIFDIVARKRDATAVEVLDDINARLPHPVCKRTIYRDLESLVEMKFLTKSAASGTYFYSLPSRDAQADVDFAKLMEG